MYTQKRDGTVVYSAGHGGANYKEFPMPSKRYSLACDNPASGVPGRAQFETDIRALIQSVTL